MKQDKIIEKLRNYIEEKGKDQVDIAVYYGSYKTQDQHELSDIDFYYVPKDQGGYELMQQFLIGQIGYDFFPMSWQRLEAMATFDAPMISLLAEGELFYVANEASRERFVALQNQIKTLQEKGNPYDFYKRANDQLKEAAYHYFQMIRLEDLSLFSIERMHFLTSLYEGIALANKAYFRKGWGKHQLQLENFDLLPEGFTTGDRQCRHASMEEGLSIAMRLYLQVESFIKDLESHLAGQPPAKEFWKGFYEEAKSTINKILVAASKQDEGQTYYATLTLEHEIYHFLAAVHEGIWSSNQSAYQRGRDEFTARGFPSLIPLALQRDYGQLQEKLRLLDQMLQSYLREQGIEIKSFETIMDFYEASL